MPFAAALAADLTVLLDASWTATAALVARRARADALPQAEVFEGPQAMDRAAAAWHRIEQAGGGATPFQSQALARQLAQVHLHRGDTPRIAVVHRHGEPVVVFPTVVTRWNGLKTVRFLGDPLIQYGDVIAARDALPSDIEAAWQAATDPALAQLIYLRKVRDDARIAPLLARSTRTAATQYAPFIDVARDATSNARDARELRRVRRRLLELGDVAFEVLQGNAAADAVGEAIALKRSWLDAQGALSRVIGDDDWEQAIHAMAGANNAPLRVARLSVDSRTAAIEIGLVHADRWCAFLGAVSPDFARYSPGHTQMAETVAYCRAHGLAIYDLLAPAEHYKRKMSHGAAAVRDYVAPLTATGWLGVLAAQGLPAVKSAAAGMPRGLRRLVFRRRQRPS